MSIDTMSFEELEPDEFILALKNEILFVEVNIAQYHILSQTPLADYDFEKQDSYHAFFDAFAKYANSRWKEKTGDKWDFSKFPFRKSDEIIKGLFRILKTGGAYTSDEGEPYTEEEATRIEQKHRKALQGDAESLTIFCYVLEDMHGEDVSSGFGVPDEMMEIRERISPYFECMAWDDLMFIINPKHQMLYVIAYTDTD